MKARGAELTGPDGSKMRIWIDEKYGLLLKMATPGKGGKFETSLVVTDFSASTPPATAFKTPAGCPKP